MQMRDAFGAFQPGVIAAQWSDRPSRNGSPVFPDHMPAARSTLIEIQRGQASERPRHIHGKCRLDGDREVHRSRDEALGVGLMVQRRCPSQVRAGGKRRTRSQRDRRKLSRAIRLLRHRALRGVFVGRHDEARLCAETEEPELVAGGQRRHQQLFGVPAVGVTAERRVRRSGDGRLARRRDVMRALVAPVGRGAGAGVARSRDRDGVSVLLA